MPREAGYREQLPELRDKWDKDDISLLRKMLDEFGFTYHPIDGSSPTSGYALSPYRNRERVIDIDQVSADSLEQYLIDNEDIWVRPDHYFGAWYNTEDGKVYLDVSIVAKTTEQAERLSVRHKQEAYYDLAAGETVYVRARGDEAGKSFAALVELELIELVRLRGLS
jgi:hypothetical protein